MENMTLRPLGEYEPRKIDAAALLLELGRELALAQLAGAMEATGLALAHDMVWQRVFPPS